MARSLPAWILIVSVLKKAVGSTIVPTLRYRDLPGAVDWLVAAFGFTPHHVTRDADGNVVAAQLVLGRGMVMLAPVGGSVFDDLMKQPDEIAGAETQSCYFIIDDADAHFAVAQAHGAETVLELQSFEHGGRGYLCRDPEGHLWSFGTFNPWGTSHGAANLLAGLSNRTAGAAALAAGLLVVSAVAAISWPGGGADHAAQSPRPSAIALFKERGARIAAQRETAQLRAERDATDLDGEKLQEQLVHLSGAKDAAVSDKASSEAALRKLTADLEQLRVQHAGSEKTVRRLVARGIQERRTRERSRRRAADQLNEALVLERSAKSRAERTTIDVKGQLEKESAARTTAERAQAQVNDQLAKEREARRKLEAALAQTSELLKKEQDARQLLEAAAADDTPAPAPRPAKRPDKAR